MVAARSSTALSALSEDLFPDDPGWLEVDAGDERRSGVLEGQAGVGGLGEVAGEVDLARHIYVYAEVAACDRGQLPILLSTLTAVSDHLDNPPPPPARRAPRPAGRLRSVGPRRVR